MRGVVHGPYQAAAASAGVAVVARHVQSVVSRCRTFYGRGSSGSRAALAAATRVPRQAFLVHASSPHTRGVSAVGGSCAPDYR